MSTHTVFCFANGVLAITGPDHEQIPALQTPWLDLVIAHLEANGIDPQACEFWTPDGYIVTLVKPDDLTLARPDGGWTWKSRKRQSPSVPGRREPPTI